MSLSLIKALPKIFSSYIKYFDGSLSEPEKKTHDFK